MSALRKQIRTAPAPANPAFGTAHRPRRKPLPASQKSNEELIAEFLAKKSVTRCATRYADGAVATSGDYYW